MIADRTSPLDLDDPAFRGVRLLTARQVASLLAVDTSTIWRWTARIENRLRCVRFGVRCTRFTLADVAAFIEGNHEGAMR